jgi:hypothetical protein
MTRTLKVWWFKRKAKQCYLRWRDFGSDLDCGTHMAQMLRGQCSDNAAVEFDYWIEKLRLLGEPVPTTKLSKV